MFVVDASPFAPAQHAAQRFAQLLAQAESQHRQGHQRGALQVIDQLLGLVGDRGPSLDAALEAICLRKRVLLAMRDR